MSIWNRIILQFRIFLAGIWRTFKQERITEQTNEKMEKFGLTWVGGFKYGEYKRTPVYQSIYEIINSRYEVRMEKWRKK